MGRLEADDTRDVGEPQAEGDSEEGTEDPSGPAHAEVDSTFNAQPVNDSEPGSGSGVAGPHITAETTALLHEAPPSVLLAFTSSATLGTT